MYWLGMAITYNEGHHLTLRLIFVKKLYSNASDLKVSKFGQNKQPIRLLIMFGKQQ